MKAIGVMLALLALAATVAGSHVRLSAFARTDAMVRVAWSARPERVETCRRVSDEELARLAAHMRRRVVCEGTTARYRLEVIRDEVPISTDTVRGGGMRHDRELYVFHEMAVAPGKSRVLVRFVRLDSSTTGDDEDDHGASRESDERRRRRAEAIPPVLAIDSVVTLAPRTVLLVMYDEQRRRLVAVTSPR